MDTLSSTPSKSEDRPVILLPSGLVIYSKAILQHIYSQFGGARNLRRNQGRMHSVTTEGFGRRDDRAEGHAREGMLHANVIDSHNDTRDASEENSHPPERRHLPRHMVWLNRSALHARTEISRDENIPRFEDTSVRPDPLDFRH
jgi:hypothetical protein